MSTPQQNLPQQQPQQPQYAPPQYAPQPTAAQPQPAAQPQYAPPQAAYTAAQPASEGRLNVPGIIALGLVAFSTLISVLSPVVYRSALSSGQSLAPVTGVVQTLQAILLLVALGLAIFGVLLRDAERWRWAAIGALVSASISVAAMVLSLIVNLFSAAFPY
ncbi:MULTISPECIES: hypothetical protein [unclassified Leucobacter]|uniref:hypothetical protein n=1 Tax=unclassified Leucobacter TaxID=2621730 RepID=UPI0006214E49|nr:hypothetical protein [Leucobacter sp. Ag1]KKI22509.1 hypothetical protein XM48_01350 [Leucobacter sp. Ag1]